MYCSPSFLILAQRIGTQCGLLLPKDALPHTLVVTSGYFCGCCLPLKAVEPFSSGTKRHFHPTAALDILFLTLDMDVRRKKKKSQ